MPKIAMIGAGPIVFCKTPLMEIFDVREIQISNHVPMI